MYMFIDDANLEGIKEIYKNYPVDGVTTNPSILAKAKKNPLETLREIRECIGEDQILFAQAVALDVPGMIEDAHKIVETIGKKNTVVKIPSIPEGFAAMRQLTAEGIAVCGTVVYTPMQAFLAAKAGAKYVAPYVNRIDNMGYDGVKVVKEIQTILEKNEMDKDCMVLAASFKNSQQVMELLMEGIGSFTASCDVISAFVKNPAIDGAVTDFVNDFKALTGTDRISEVK